MKRLVKFSVHEYMDKYPHTEVGVYEGESIKDITSKAQEWAEYMTKAYSGGPTSFESVFTAKDAFKWFKSEIQSIDYPLEEDLDWIAKTSRLIAECYSL